MKPERSARRCKLAVRSWSLEASPVGPTEVPSLACRPVRLLRRQSGRRSGSIGTQALIVLEDALAKERLVGAARAGGAVHLRRVAGRPEPMRRVDRLQRLEIGVVQVAC